MKNSIKKMHHIAICVMAVIVMIASMAAISFAAEANESVNEARSGVVHIRVMYKADDGTDYDVQWGSGFLVNDMTVMTCFHVVYVTDETIQDMRDSDDYGPLVEGKTNKQIRDRIVVKITVYHDSSVSAEVDEGVKSQNADFVALKLKTKLADHTPLPIRDSKDVSVTESSYVLGFPYKMVALKGYEATKFTKDAVEVTSGAVKKVDVMKSTGAMNIYMTETTSEGYSGGPMIDADGNVIGICYGHDDNQTAAVASEEFIPVLSGLEIEYTSADGSSETENTDNNVDDTEETDKEDVPALPEPEPEPEPKSILPFIIGGAAAVIIIIILLVVLLTRKKKDAPAPAGTYAPAGGPTPVVPPTGTGGVGGAAPRVPAAVPRPDTGVLGQGSNETTVLGQGAGETTVLSSNQANGSLTRSKTGEKISISRDNFKIGRERSRVDYCISDNTAIGRHHATIVIRNGEAYLIDQNSRNFTFVNDVKVSPNTETKLNNGDKVAFADEVFTYNA